MSLAISINEYFGHYINSADVTPAVQQAARTMLDKVNALYARAAEDGCELPDNPATGSGVAGSGHGGFRDAACTVGAANSQHRMGHAVDRFDPSRRFGAWCLAHPVSLRELGLYMEDARWTPSWVHLQDVAPGSGNHVFIPSAAPALAALPTPWVDQQSKGFA